MADKTRIIDIYEKGGGFTSYFRKFSGQKKDYNYSDLSILRQLFSNEKARLLHFIKMKKPESIYSLAKSLGKDFKTVHSDLLVLKKFGFIDIVEEKRNGRTTHKPVLTATSINIVIRI
jgi:predicted transcriptional regulator